jgi:dTDP-4-dehydrorhamnose reductase
MIWLIGNRGMLGTEFSLLLESRGIPFVGTDREVDIANPAALASFAEKETAAGRPFNWIINCAAYTAVDRAEDDVEACRRLNTQGAANIARCAEKAGAGIIHISTDYVFNGRGTRPYREDDPADPIGVYGLTKRDGEMAVLENNPRSYIIRTAWLYGRYGGNFVHTMLRLMKERDEVKVVNDQRGSPTWAFDLARIILALMEAADGPADAGGGFRASTPNSLCAIDPGIYHFTNEGDITWFDFARKIYEQGRGLGLLTKDCVVKPCTSAEFPAKVKRPAYSVLDKGKIKKALGMEAAGWEESLEKFMEVTAKNQNTAGQCPEERR